MTDASTGAQENRRGVARPAGACKSCSSEWWQVVDERRREAIAGAVQTLQRDGFLTGHYCTLNDNTRGLRVGHVPWTYWSRPCRTSGCFSDHSLIGNISGRVTWKHCTVAVGQTKFKLPHQIRGRFLKGWMNPHQIAEQLVNKRANLPLGYIPLADTANQQPA